MPGEWKHMPLAEAIDLISGGTPKTSVPGYWDGSIPWLSVSDFNTGYRWVSVAAKSITDRGLSESATAILNQGDIIISARGTVGVVAQLAKPMAFNQSCYGVRGKRGISDTDFIYYTLRHAVSRMKQVAHGGVFDTITRDTFKIVEIDLPPFKEQCAIAHILGSLDDKIELNRRINKTLEAMASAIFKSWFVDFDPVHAKAEGRDHGLPGEIATLFPDSFEESELGEIPKGWEVGTLKEFALLKIVATQPHTFPEKIWEHYSIPAFDEGRQPIWEAGKAIKSGKYVVPRNSVLASKLNPQFPRVWLPDIQDADSAICSTEFMSFVPNTESWRPFLYEMLQSQPVQSEILSRVTGSTGSRQRVKPKEIATMVCLVPSKEVINFFCEQVGPLHLKQISNIRQNSTLTSLRDTLLPKLISGELRISDAEKFIEEAGP